jgi:MinD superfamily P-loop ATPase
VIVAVLSGKGGTGKTTVAVSLALTLVGRGRRVQLVDADVEEPNCRLFLAPQVVRSEPVHVLRPVIDEGLCAGCGTCAATCRFGALIQLGDRLLSFPELCHSCGGCALVCPEEAITEHPHEVGTVTRGAVRDLELLEGRLRVGEPRAIPVIQALLERLDPGAIAVMDGPPGTGCPAVEVIRAADFVCLVGEPTPFGLHDLKLTVETVRTLARPFGVMVNRAGLGDDGLERYLAIERIEPLAEIPEERRIAVATSRGRPLVDAIPDLRAKFEGLAERIETRLDGIRSGRRAVAG